MKYNNTQDTGRIYPYDYRHYYFINYGTVHNVIVRFVRMSDEGCYWVLYT